MIKRLHNDPIANPTLKVKISPNACFITITLISMVPEDGISETN
jgi:hypothetical protein